MSLQASSGRSHRTGALERTEKGTWGEMSVNIQHAPRGMEAAPLQTEICPSPQEPARRLTLFILQTEWLIGSNLRPAPTAQSSPQSHPQHVCLGCFGAVLFGKGEKGKESGEEGGGERAGMAEETVSGRPREQSGSLCRALAGTANLAGREASKWLLLFKDVGWGLGDG